MNNLEKISVLLKDNKMRQVDLARALNVTESTVSMWFKGKSNTYTKYYIELSKIFNVPVNYFVDDDYIKEDKVIELWNKLSDKQKFLLFSLMLDIVKE